MDAPMTERVDYFYSFRSPYSYLSAPRAFGLPEPFDVELAFHGVIPMAMRGQSVPRVKRLHTLRDVAREARRLRMPFGRIHDPIGEGAMRCLLLAQLADSQGGAREFVLEAGRGIWGEAIDVSSDDGLREVATRAGLSWPDCLGALADPSLRERVEQDTAALAELGHWGVPVLVLRGELFWGQDRIVDLEAALEDAGLRRQTQALGYGASAPAGGDAD
jgi:2-hydroxychromene-2-carboxylate isomerase